MKKDNAFLLVGLTILFVGFILGMIVGRSIVNDPVVIQVPESAPPITFPPETDEATPGQETQPSSDGKININTASAEMLDSLPGIGPTIAQRIVEYRQDHGPFQKIVELTLVEGIGSAKLNQIYNLVKLED
jgi:competence protein ComEA